ncbi:hypothetical protein P175DRAFT_0443568 [Aspergillus ochraceoroseus IBT 24754]|uniref:Rhodopsin domain-containing protein n=2 Tax=Aspergillus ochraceoroseus TaxID=138278 RepID=A0A2T5LP26_9EURO|nr:uncharacterized protein P175DRAFT_0443568 [Aspergillus ochraceoroseus IBT 24754]KKK19412.1 hypothetical protein AOCH_001339 [Aspergillus ochraceoroseus]PTU18031.1 hypothetical protein P175DRAFT_0443568 [Aspergillus ochraceoroseus IBT 24754]
MATTNSLSSLLARQAPSQTNIPDSVPYTNAPRIIAIVGTLTGLSALLVILRCYVRIFVLRRFHVEDGIMIISLACAVGVLACFVGECDHGLGRFFKDIGPNDYELLAKWLWYHSIIIVLGISLVKISLGIFLIRFAGQKKGLKKFILGTVIFLVLATVGCILTLILQCIPVQAAWDYSLRKNAKCYSNKTYLAIGQFNSAINITTDFLYTTLPVWMFWNIQVNKRTKTSLMGILSLGYFACAAAIAKAVLQPRVYTQPEFFRDGNYLIWNCIELNIGILAACFPTIKPLVKSIIGSSRGRSYGSRSRKRTGNAYCDPSAYGPNSHAMGSMQGSRMDREEQKYQVQIHANHPSVSESDGGSEENLATNRQSHRINTSGIVQTTEVIVHSEYSSEMGVPGPKRTVEDRI